jgi:hypothetical protein
VVPHLIEVLSDGLSSLGGSAMGSRHFGDPQLAGGERVGVIRGFVGFTPDGSVVDAPAGEVTVTGVSG